MLQCQAHMVTAARAREKMSFVCVHVCPLDKSLLLAEGIYLDVSLAHKDWDRDNFVCEPSCVRLVRLVCLVRLVESA
jgi:hypothetical protein